MKKRGNPHRNKKKPKDNSIRALMRTRKADLCNKVCYPTKEKADAFLKRIISEHEKEYEFLEKMPKRSYYCKKCSAYHLTSQTKTYNN